MEPVPGTSETSKLLRWLEECKGWQPSMAMLNKLKQMQDANFELTQELQARIP